MSDLTFIIFVQIESLEDVEYVEKDMLIEASSLPNWAWHIDRIDQTTLPLDHAFKTNFTGQGVDIYVMDSGIRYSHYIFGGRAHFGGYDPTGGNGEDCNGHGTHVAGLAAGNITGVAIGANVFSIKVLRCVGTRITGNLRHLIDALDFTIAKIKSSGRPSVITLSLIVQTGASKSLELSIKKAYREGITVISAAGNFFQDACNYSPASSEYTITVGGTRRYRDRLYRSTNYGKCVDIFAPGESVVSAGYDHDRRMTTKSGTSMATPIVAGAVAMLLEEDPSLTPQQIKEELINRSTKNVLDFNQLPTKARSLTPNRLVYIGVNQGENHTQSTQKTATATTTPPKTTVTTRPTDRPNPLPNVPSRVSVPLTYHQLRTDINSKRNAGYAPTNVNSYTSVDGDVLFTIVYTHVGTEMARKYYALLSENLEDVKRKTSLSYWTPVTFTPYKIRGEIRVFLVMKLVKNNRILSMEKTMEEFDAERTTMKARGYEPVVVRYRLLENGSSTVYTIYQKWATSYLLTDMKYSELFTLSYQEKSVGNYISDITYHRKTDGSTAYTATFDRGPSKYYATSLHVDLRRNLSTFLTVFRVLRNTGRQLMALTPTFEGKSAPPGFLAIYWK